MNKHIEYDTASSGVIDAIMRPLEGEPDQECVFCQIVSGRAPAKIVQKWDEVIAIVPLLPVVEGHILVIPKRHVQDFRDVPHVSGKVMEAAASIAPYPSNLITSAGQEATQSVYHLHLHIVPRAYNDGLALPWHSGKHKNNN
jgi:histidine triad (HIT) family protein